jgi:TIR domain/SIR2-like domain
LNYDSLIEQATARQAITWRSDDKVQDILRRVNTDAVLHLNGYFDEPESVVLGLSSYGKVADHAHTKAVLQLFALDRTLLFVGCGEGMVKDLVGWAKDALKDIPPRHVLLCREQELKTMRADLASAPWLLPLAYGENHKELVPFLRDLAPRPSALLPKPAPVGHIFINYRRDDSSAWAGRLYDRLSSRFASSQIFMDVDLDAGIDFVQAIGESVGSCDVLIAVIGKGWLTSCDQEGQRRLDDPEDFLRVEIVTALKRGIRVIPVLVDGASMPRSRDLPEDLKSLRSRNALEVSHNRFRADSERLINAVERASGFGAGLAKQTHGHDLA